MTADVGGVRVAIGKIVLEHDSVGNPITVGIRAKGRMVEVNARINHDHRHIRTVKSREALVRIVFVKINEDARCRGGRGCRELAGQIQRRGRSAEDIRHGSQLLRSAGMCLQPALREIQANDMGPGSQVLKYISTIAASLGRFFVSVQFPVIIFVNIHGPTDQGRLLLLKYTIVILVMPDQAANRTQLHHTGIPVEVVARQQGESVRTASIDRGVTVNCVIVTLISQGQCVSFRHLKYQIVLFISIPIAKAIGPICARCLAIQF